jgi:hypothetical protein
MNHYVNQEDNSVVVLNDSQDEVTLGDKKVKYVKKNVHESRLVGKPIARTAPVGKDKHPGAFEAMSGTAPKAQVTPVILTAPKDKQP